MMRASARAVWGRLFFCMVVGAWMLGPTRAWAQTPVDGAIAGVVLDAKGAAVVGAEIVVRSDTTDAEMRTHSGAAGEFELVHVAPGTSTVTVGGVGLASSERMQVAVEVGGVTVVRVRLLGGAMRTSTVVQTSTTVTVTAEESAGSAVSSVVTEGEIAQLPLDGSAWRGFALLTSTAGDAASSDNSDNDGGSSPLLSYRGLPATQNSDTIDGVSDDQGFRSGARGQAGGGSRAEYTFSEAAVREFRVNAHNYGAQYGNAVGGTVNTVSKSGTNTLHGSGFYTLRTSALAATNPFAIATQYVNGVVTSETVKPHDLRQQTGATIGGAARRGRLFYFYTYDQQQRSFPGVSSPSYAGFYTLTPSQTALLRNTREVSAAQINTALNYLDSLTGTVARQADQTVNFGKLDWQRTGRERLSLEYNRARFSSPAGVATAQVVDRGTASFGNSYLKVDAVVGRWLRQVSPHVTEELRVQYGRDFEYELAQAPLTQEPGIGPGGFAPQVTIGQEADAADGESSATGFVYGTPSTLGRQAYPDERRMQVVEGVTWVRGQHELMVGVDFNRVHDFVQSLANGAGSFSYDSGITSGHAGGIVDWITDYTFNANVNPSGGCPNGPPPPQGKLHYFCFRDFSQSFGATTVSFNTQEWSGYVQDMWRPRQGLTVNAGVRGEYLLLPLPQQPNVALDAIFGGVGATSVFPEDRNNFGPRLGLAWTPLGMPAWMPFGISPKLSAWARGIVVRAGYGVYFGRLPGATMRGALLNTALNSSTTHVRITPLTITQCPQVATAQGFGYPCAYVSDPPAAVAATTSAMVFDRRFRLPVVQQGELTLEQSVGGGVMASASYLLDRGTQLPNSVDVNILPATSVGEFVLQGSDGKGVRNGETFVVPVYTSRISANYGPVTDILSNANANYNAMVLEARRRLQGGLEFRVSWTWSKAIDYGQNSGATPRTNGQFDPFNVRYDRGLAAVNYPHKVVANVVWEPRLRGERFVPVKLAKELEAWSMSSIFTESSGKPYSYEIFGGTRLSGGRESINGSGGATYLPTVGRNTLRLPDTVNLDLRVQRTFRVRDMGQATHRALDRVRPGFGEGATVRAFVEGFNVMNRENLSAVTQRAFVLGTPIAATGTAPAMTPLVFQDAATVAAEGLNVQPFGTYTAAATNLRRERQVEIGVKVEF